MRTASLLTAAALTSSAAAQWGWGSWGGGSGGGKPYPHPGKPGKITPKVFLISMFQPEAVVWYDKPGFDFLANNITLPGLSPLFPTVHCIPSYEVCQVITGESEINAAATISALALSPVFDLTKTYFLVGGIAGVNPNEATLADVTFARYAIQVALQYEFGDADKPANFSSGYFPQGAYSPQGYPESIYGTEVFEFNDALRQRAAAFARTATLNDSAEAIAYRANYASTPAYAAGASPSGPSVRLCDVATSDVYFSGTELGEAFDAYTTLVTNGTGVYCTTAQEDNATAEALIRAALAKLVDFSRLIVMRTCSDFDRPYAGEEAVTNLLYAAQGAFEPAIENIYLAGSKVINGIIAEWDNVYEAGVTPTNYIGDIYNSLPNPPIAPDFGLAEDYLDAQLAEYGGLKKRHAMRTAALRRRGLPVMQLPRA